LARVEHARSRPDQCCGLLQADVADEVQTNRAMAQVTERAGLPDIVVNSAGIVQPGYFEDLDLGLFRDMMDVNYFGTLHVCKALIPGMIARRSGHLVNVASASAFLPVFGYSAYSASKHAVRGLSEVLRLELKAHGVGVSIVYPPDTDTPQLVYEEAYKPPETRAFSAGVVVSPTAVARAIVSGVARTRFIITPGFETSAARRLTELLGDLQYPLLDLIVSRARRAKTNRELS
jgi:3-dehydrosphinganine reductase